MILIAIFLAYLLGSIPSGLLLTKAAGLGDVRAIGSGNIGATNVLRTGNKKLAGLTLLCDGLKGALAVWLAGKINGRLPLSPSFDMYAAGLAAVLGHVYPVWLHFRGGKGVATTLGVILALSPLAGAFFVILWLAVFIQTRISSLAALTAMTLILLCVAFNFAHLGDSGGINAPFFYAFVWLLMIFTHRANLQRLLHGTEHRFRPPDK
jgi:glycerol-3-phosphate acyltransferase PlsY